MSQAHILIVEDDLPLAEVMGRVLSKAGYTVSIESRGDHALNRVEELRPQLVILDWMLPGLDGIEVCKRLRASYQGRILMLTAKESDADQILGFEVGADDYVVKPIQSRLLLARVQAHLRRAQLSEGLEIRVDNLHIDAAKRIVKVDDKTLELTTSEFDLLFYLASHPGQTLSRQDIYLALRGIDYDGVDRSIDLRISKLRAHLKQAGFERQVIKTVHGRGYHFAVSPEGSEQGAEG